MTLQHNNEQINVKLFQRNKTSDLIVILLQTFYKIKFKDKFETVLGEEELFDKSTAVRFENDFISKCFFCGCNNNQFNVNISHLIIRKVSLIELFKQFKKQFKNKNMLKQAVEILLEAFLNGLQPNKHILVYDDNNNCFIKLCQSITYARIRRFIDSFKMFNFFNWIFQNDGSSKKSISLSLIYETLKRTKIGKDAEINFFYTLIDNSCLTTASEKYDVIFCKKEHRKTYLICETTSFFREIKDKSPKNYNFFKNMYDFLGL
jgi:hypothetical protein